MVSEYHAEGVQAPSAMVRCGRHKLIVSPQDPDLLYDLEADPLELTDVSGSAEEGGRWHGCRRALARRLDLDDIDARVRASQRERFLVSRALRQGRPTPWDHDPPYDAAARYIRNREDLYELQRRARLDSGSPE